MSLTNPKSAFAFLSRGALIQEFKIAGHNVVQSFPDANFYKTHNDAYLGETIGRTTNRVKGATLQNLNGQSYKLAVNDGDYPNSLHGGLRGWGKQDFEGPKPVNRNGREGVQFRYLSRDGEEGYPGTVECLVWYTASMEGDKTVLEIEYQVELVGDECEETVCGVTNHRYTFPCASAMSKSFAIHEISKDWTDDASLQLLPCQPWHVNDGRHCHHSRY